MTRRRCRPRSRRPRSRRRRRPSPGVWFLDWESLPERSSRRSGRPVENRIIRAWPSLRRPMGWGHSTAASGPAWPIGGRGQAEGVQPAAQSPLFRGARGAGGRTGLAVLDSHAGRRVRVGSSDLALREVALGAL